MKTTKWKKFLAFIGQQPIGIHFTRSQMFEELPDFKKQDIYNYRLHLERAGFMKTTGSDTYERTDELPETFPWRKCIRLAYPERFKKMRLQSISRIHAHRHPELQQSA